MPDLFLFFPVCFRDNVANLVFWYFIKAFVLRKQNLFLDLWRDIYHVGYLADLGVGSARYQSRPVCDDKVYALIQPALLKNKLKMQDDFDLLYSSDVGKYDRSDNAFFV